MKIYGQIYQTSEFILRLIPKKSQINSDSQSFIVSTLNFLRDLDLIQQENPFVTLSISTADGLWVYYKGNQEFFLKPTQHYILLHIFKKNDLSDVIDKLNDMFQDSDEKEYAYRLFRFRRSDEFNWIINYININWKYGNKLSETYTISHPRYIPGEVRQLALTEFIRKGRLCPGVSGKKSKHKVSKTTPIEFDHILPHSEGGSNSDLNVQVLCADCNRLKRATAK